MIDTAQSIQTIAVTPQPPTTVTVDTPPQPARPPSPVITNPQWISRPNADQLASFYPAKALDNGLSGRAVLTCMVTASGAPSACQITSETPAHAGFGQAALKLAPFFKLSPRLENGQPVDGAVVVIPLDFDTSSD